MGMTAISVLGTDSFSHIIFGLRHLIDAPYEIRTSVQNKLSNKFLSKIADPYFFSLNIFSLWKNVHFKGQNEIS